MKKILFQVANLLFIPLFIGVITIYFQEWYELKKEKQKAIYRIYSVKSVYENFLSDFTADTTHVLSGNKDPEDSLISKTRELYYIALIHIQEELISVRKENEILPYLSEYMRYHLSKFALEAEHELKTDSESRSPEEISEGLKRFSRQQACFELEIQYLSDKITEEELKEKGDHILHAEPSKVLSKNHNE